MAKGNSRKRANGNKKEEKKVSQLPPLVQGEAAYFNELVETSNMYADLLKQKAQYEYITGQLVENRKKVQQDKIKLPVNITVIPKVMTYPESDKKIVLALFDKHIKIFQDNTATIVAQLEFAYENFKESGVRNKEFLAARFEKVQAKNIVLARKIIKDEETLFEAEFSDMVKVEGGKKVRDEKKIKELKNAVKEANKRNAKNKTVCECKSCKSKK